MGANVPFAPGGNRMPMSRRTFLGSSVAAATLAASGAITVARAEKPLSILILGGTGFIGPHQVRYAVARGHKVSVFNRGKTNPGLFPEVEHLEGDRNGQLDALKDRKWDAVIDNPTTLPRWVRDAAAILEGNTAQYLFISTVSVYADNAKPWADESAAVIELPDPTVEKVTGETYGGLKALAEKEVLKAFPGKATIVRPGLIVGPGDATDRFTYWPVRIARGGEVLAPGDGSDPVQFIDARDLAEWTIRLVEQRAFGTFNALGGAAVRHPRGDDVGREVHLGAGGFPRKAESESVVGHAGVGAGQRRQRRFRTAQQQARDRGRADVPPARRHGQGHARLSRHASGRGEGEAEGGAVAGARGGSARGVEEEIDRRLPRLNSARHAEPLDLHS
jgi:nucleoside-diphosphate-sugar epimerase